MTAARRQSAVAAGRLLSSLSGSVAGGRQRLPAITWCLPAMLVALLLITSCGAPASMLGPVTIRVGYFPNIKHAQAVIGVADGSF